jgi:hypothetical protein
MRITASAFRVNRYYWKDFRNRSAQRPASLGGFGQVRLQSRRKVPGRDP